MRGQHARPARRRRRLVPQRGGIARKNRSAHRRSEHHRPLLGYSGWARWSSRIRVMQLGGTAPVANSLQGKALGLDRSPPRQPSTAVMRRSANRSANACPSARGRTIWLASTVAPSDGHSGWWHRQTGQPRSNPGRRPGRQARPTRSAGTRQ
jgi:hypothetical protein